MDASTWTHLLRTAVTCVALAALVTGCDSWPFGSDPVLEWESGDAAVLDYPLGEIYVDAEDGTIQLRGQFEGPPGRVPDGHLAGPV